MVKKSLVWLYSAATYLLWAAVIVVASVVLALRYYLLPHVNDYRDDIAKHVSEAAGLRMTIGEIRAGWSGMHPYLDLYRVNLFDVQGRPALQLDHVETGFSWLSLPLGEPRLASLTVYQPKLTIRREADGTVYVAGISMSGPSRPAFPNWLLRQSQIDVIDASVMWQDDLRHAPPLALEKLNLRVSSPAWESLLGHHRFGLHAVPSAGASMPIDIRGNLWGKDVGQPDAWRGTLYARLEGTDIAAWRTWLDFPFDLVRGFGATQFWLDFSHGQASKLTADVLLADVQARLARNVPETAFQRLSGRLGWQRLENGQVLRAEKLALATAEGFSLQQGALNVKSTLRDGKEMVDGEATLDTVDLRPFATFAANLPLGQQIQDQLTGLAPQGRLLKTRFNWQGDREAVRQYRLRSDFSDLAIRPTNGIPGFSGLSGRLEATEQNGSLHIDSRNAALDLKGILRWPIPADRLAGDVKWQLKSGVTEVQVNQLAISSQHLSGALNASYRYDGTKSGYLDLDAKFDHADGKFAKFYYPLVLDQATLDWLDTSLFNGRGQNVHVVLKGYLDDFPYAGNKNGEFKVSARIDDGLVDYANGWPKVEGVGLDMLFSGNRMDLAVDRGRIFGAQISQAKISIPVLDADHPVLQIQGEVQAPAQDVLKFVNKSPVSEAINHFTDGMSATGGGKVQLDIQVPLDNPDATHVKGAYNIGNGALTGGQSFPALDHVNGRLNFTEASISAKNMAANIYGSPAQFNLETGANGLIRVTASGRIDEAGLARIYTHPLLQRVHGSTDWNAEITQQEKQTQIAIRSTLAGLAVSLPPPFNKSASDNLPLRIDLQQKNAGQDVLSMTAGNLVSAKMLRTQSRQGVQVERGEVNFGGTAGLPEQRGIVVNGKFAQLDWDWWHEMLGDARKSADGGTAVVAANLEIGTLDIFGRRINALNLKASAVADGWMTTLQSRELNGDVRWQSAGRGKVLARLKTLTIPAAAPAKMTAPDAQDTAPEYPALDIVVENFEARGKELGRLELLASQQGGDWNIQRLRISNPDSTLNVDGDWHSWKRNPDTRINVNWDIDDVGKTLERFGYPGTIKGGNAILTGDLRWQGSPHEFNLPGLGGQLQLDAKRGQFLKIQPGVGRLLGVLSLQALPRRLLFDFRDLFNDGFAFDQIGGTVKIDHGVMRSKDFKMDGPAAKVGISGETDLDRETLNLHVKVSPALSDTLSIAALAGGPVAGAAAFVAQKLLRDPFNKIASYEYDITGTWDNPQEVKAGADKKENPTPNPLGK